MENILGRSLADSIAAKQDFYRDHRQQLFQLVDWVVACFRAGNKLMICGNGGSAADAQHLAAEFVNRFLINRAPLPALALTTDTSILTSVGNDFSYDDIFAKQVEALGKKGDILLGISTSGNSPNVVRAFDAARKIGVRTVVLTGGSGGRLAGEAELVLSVPSAKTPHIQETHLWIEHMLCWLVDERLFGSLQDGNVPQ
ncbi:MAG: D-sedoheptulose 7-phosphate isomerase [Proteobacteria bacterium]|nr:D-sedoheptulose 7-phosphate isomerase [Pseudomonadota bacterium]MBU0965522.1 D-sedoheptulose 7-phosphate isomerase [Pseudomonadota bacterium]